MDQTEQDTAITETQIVPSYGLLYITRAYNQGEISLDEWLLLARAWAEAILRQQSPHEPAAPD